jgi:hypothetical protein
MTTTVARTPGGSLPNGAFLPEFWDTKLNMYLKQMTCLEKVTNNDYGGGLMHKGGVVHIRSEPRVNTFDYVIGNDMPVQNIDDEEIELLINKNKAFNFFVDSIDLAQTDIALVEALTSSAAYQTKVDIETVVFGSVYADAGNALAQTAVDSTNAMKWALTASATLSSEGVQPRDRFLVVPAFVALQLQLSDIKAANMMGDAESVARSAIGTNNDFLGDIGGMMVYASEQVAQANGIYQCFAGSKRAICYAAQFTKSEHFKSEKRMGDGIRGMTVYGFKVIQPNALVSMPCTINLGI